MRSFLRGFIALGDLTQSLFCPFYICFGDLIELRRKDRFKRELISYLGQFPYSIM